jgi:TPR repeat protein
MKVFVNTKSLRLLWAIAVISFAVPANAEIEAGRDLMDAGKFEEAMKEFLPAARSGNADAEELIGVMYAMGLGVERDDARAFEWYLRSAMKGHPGAQSGVGWYYEVGRGMEAPDLVRAYMWYVLSAIGGDPDAAISQEEVVKKMTKEQIEKAHILIDDYRVWLYPFR